MSYVNCEYVDMADDGSLIQMWCNIFWITYCPWVGEYNIKSFEIKFVGVW